MKVKWFCILAVGFLAFAVSALAYEYDSEINPNDFNSWEVVEVGQCPDSPLICVLLKNPNKDSPYTEALIVISPRTGSIIVYILKNGEIYESYKHDGVNRYVRIHFTPPT